MMQTDKLCLLLLVVLVLTVGASGRKNKKSKKKMPPQWKSTSMPYMNKRFQLEYEQQDVKLDCKAQGRPKPSITWLKNGVKLMQDSDVRIRMNKYSLVMNNISTDMGGNYTCVVNNKHGQLEWTFMVDVQVKVWPITIEGPHNVTQVAGSTVHFRCRINDRKGTIRWMKMDDTSDKDFLEDPENPEVLTLENIQEEDEGQYQCVAGNMWGLVYGSAWLKVISPVIVPSMPSFPGSDIRNGGRDRGFGGSYDPNNNNNYNNNNNNNQGHLFPDEFDSEETIDVDYGSVSYYTTTRRPRNKNNSGRGRGRKKNGGRKKNKKNKNKGLFDPDEEIFTAKTTPKTTTAATAKTTFLIKYNSDTESSKIWDFGEEDREVGYDTRVDPNLEDLFGEEIEDEVYPQIVNGEVEVEDGEKSQQSSGDEDKETGSISTWTIYTIVGAVGGVILLAGLVAITFAVCCRKDEEGVYKSTPV